MNKLMIIGAGGHGKVIADIALKNGYTDICFVDDNATGECIGFSIIGNISDIEQFNDGNTDFVIAIGDNFTRKNIAEKYGVKWVTLIHPSAQIGSYVSIGEGSVVMANAVINPCSKIGCHCIINTGAIVEHDSSLGDFVHISPRATLSGSVNVGELTWIGAGATLVNNVNICDRAIVGAGAIVTKTINDKGTYVGVPARKIK